MTIKLKAFVSTMGLVLCGNVLAETEVQKLRTDVEELKKEVQKAAEWKVPSTLIHMSGYADVGYTSNENANDSFSVGSFSPIFHYQYRDLVMLESELELEVEADGSTKTELEYLTIDLFLSDNITFVGGKFLSPIGQFRQNLHPSWINKLPTAPPGFGHDGAAPVSDLGMQLRGGIPVGGMRTNYAVYVGNGPELITEWDGSGFELDGVDAEARNADRDNKKVIGGRFAILPVTGLEIGLSAVTGKATVTKVEDDLGTAPTLANEVARDYDVLGFDFAWQMKKIALRGEYVKTEVGDATGGASASTGGEWTTWYTQFAYQFLPTKVETVVRYTDFDSVGTSNDQEQWALGMNYLFTNSVIGKIAYEFNDGATGSTADDDRLMLQLAYGF